MSSTLHFYANIPSFVSLQNMFASQNYHALPADWWLCLTDVRGSTKAIEQGRYKEVNVIGVSTIIALQNVFGEVDIPFIFGGDGATLALPPDRHDEVRQTLAHCRTMAKKQFGFDLRVAMIPVAKIYEQGLSCEVAKMQISEGAAISMMRGQGFHRAEEMLKDTSLQYLLEHQVNQKGHFKGLECRWNPVPATGAGILTVIVQSRRPELSAQIYQEIVSQTEKHLPQVAPVRVENLPARWPPQHLHIEAKVHHKNILLQLWHMTKATLWVSLLTPIFKKYRHQKEGPVIKYMRELSQNTDFIKFDETLRMVLDVSQEQKKQIEELLLHKEMQNEIYYGTHFSSEALMTCYVQSKTKHIHFVDGGNGGYTMAAKVLKNKKPKN